MILMRLFIITILLCASAWAQSVTDLFGKTYVDVIRAYGYPNAIFPVRQSIPDKDDVVFEYAGSFLYLYSNRCYRAFYSSEYTGVITGTLKIGSSKTSVIELFGSRYTLEKEGLVWKKDKYIIIAKLDEANCLKSLWFITKVEK